MQSRVQKWGNGLGVRIPQALAGQIGLGADSEESLSARDGALVVKSVHPTRLNLDDLLAGVTAENLHPSVETGDADGLEII
jgi:antitoxin MazE